MISPRERSATILRKRLRIRCKQHSRVALPRNNFHVQHIAISADYRPSPSIAVILASYSGRVIRRLRQNSECNMPIHERPFDSVEQLHETVLEEHRSMFESGVPLAVTAAMAYCDKHGVSTPPWAIRELVNIQCATIRDDIPGKRGRSNGISHRYRQDAIDYIRWDMVIEIRETRQVLKDKIKAFSELPGRTAYEQRIYDKKILRWAKAGSFKRASMLLAGSIAFGGPEAVKTSFGKVEKNMREQKTAMRYYILNPAFLRKIGVVLDPPVNPGKKIVDLFDRTK